VDQATGAPMRSRAYLWFLAVIMTALIFVVDLQIPFGVASGVPYVAVILIGWWLPNRRPIIVFAVVCSLLTLVGFALSAPGGILWMVVTNGFLAISVIWVTAVLLFQAKAASEQLIQSHNSLEYQVMKRTKELSERVTIKEHTEEALKESMERLKITLETASDRFWEMDENFRLCNLTNYTGAKPLPGKEKFLGKTRWEAAGGDPEKDEKWRQHRDDHLAHRPYRDFEFSVTDKNGEDHYLSASGIPVFNDDGTFKGYRGSARNITASKMTELALMVSQNRFESILELAADAIISLDENHRITFFNAAA